MRELKRLTAFVVSVIMLCMLIPVNAAQSATKVTDASITGWVATNNYADAGAYIDTSEGDRAVVLRFDGNYELWSPGQSRNLQFTQTTQLMKAGTTYCFEFDAKAKNAKVNFQFNWNTRISMTPGTSSYDWQKIKLSYTPNVDETTVLRFIIEDQTDGFWLNNAKFYAVDNPEVQLISNGDFEMGGGAAYSPKQTTTEDGEIVEATPTEDLNKAQKTTMFADRRTITVDANEDDWSGVESFPVAYKETFFGTKVGTGDITGGDVKFAYDDKNWYFYLKINDTTHFALPDPSYWNGDGIQFNTAMISNPEGSRVEKGAVLYHDGSGSFQTSEDFTVKMKREGNTTIYEVAYPWTVNFGGTVPKVMLANISANNNFGGIGQTYHDCAYSITEGIVSGKAPFKYNPLVLWHPLGDSGVEYGIVPHLSMDIGMTRNHEVNLRNTTSTPKTVEVKIPELNYNKIITVNGNEKKQIPISFTMREEEDLHINTTLVCGDDTVSQENRVMVNVIRDASNFPAVKAKLQGYADELSSLIAQCQAKGIEVEYERAGHSIITKFIERTQYEVDNGDYRRVFQYEKELKTIYEECRDLMKAYLAGEKQPRHISKYITSDLKLDGTSVIGKTETNGVIEEKPVFLVGYCTWENGPSFMEHFATIGASAIQTSTSIYDFISPIRGGGWSTGGRKDSGLSDVKWGTTEEEAYSGKYSLKVTNPTATKRNTYVTLGQLFDAKPNTTYEYGFVAKGSGMTEQKKANDVASARCNLNGIYSGVREGIANSDDWQHYNFTYTTKPGEESLEFLFILQDKIDKLYIDDVYVREKGSDENIIFNSDFEYYPEEKDVISSEQEMIDKYGWYYNYFWVEKLRKTFRLAEQYNVAFDIIIGINSMPDFMVYYDPAVLEAGRTEHFNPVPLDNQSIIESLAFFGNMIADLAKESEAPVSLCIANEPKVYASDGHYYIPHWQAFLTERYGTIEKLNETYGSEYKSFEEVLMPTGVVANPVYTDYRDFNDTILFNFHKAIIEPIRAKNDDLFYHSKIMQYFRENWARYYAMGTNPEMLMPIEDVNGCDAWAAPGGNKITDKMAWHDMLTSIADQPVWNTEDHNAADGTPPSYPEIEPFFSSTDLWNCAMHGLGFSAMWWMETRPNIMPWAGAASSVASSNAMHKPLRMWETAKVTFDINRLSKEITAIKDKPENVGILYSRIATSYNSDYINKTSAAYEDTIFSGQRAGFIADSTPEHIFKYDLVIVPGATHVKADFVENLKKHLENGGKVLLLGENCILKDEYDRPHNQEIIDYIYANADTTSTVFEKIDELGYSDVVLVNAETGEKLDNIEWSYAEYEGKIVMTTTNFDTEKTIPIKIQYKGKDVPVFTQMRTMEQINGSYVLEPFKPIFIQFDI